jgi:replicative DNA helicase
MRELKRIAIETDTVIFLIAHLQKTRLEKAPTISDLRDSSFVGQEADMVFLVWREVKDIDSIEKYGKDSFLKIEKNRRKGTLCGFRMKHENKRFKVIAGGNYE